ncbi:MAG: hypothetical protein JWM74_4790 [Myxococcaceae bacterium]|jgi:hypothetical protein|nr:hypothetical protein [Myxococcaceae bacterium]
MPRTLPFTLVILASACVCACAGSATRDATPRDPAPRAPLAASSPEDVTRERARVLHRGMTTWRTKDPDRCPTFADLQAAGIVAKDAPLIDAWGVELRGYCNETTSLVRSAGPDRRIDTPDDVVEGTLVEAP